MSTPKLRDYLGNLIWYDDTIVYAATRGARKGTVLEINEYVGDSDTTWTITMIEDLPDRKTRKKTFDYDRDRIVVINA